MPAAIPGRISTQVRIDKITWEKIKAIAKLENRNANSQTEYFLKKSVQEYESRNGPISVTPDA